MVEQKINYEDLRKYVKEGLTADEIMKKFKLKSIASQVSSPHSCKVSPLR